MSHTDASDVLVRYLLDDCSEQERTRVEEQFFANDDTFARLCELEEDLAARYVRGELRADERAHFERAYSTPPRRDRLVLNLALGRILTSRPVSSTSSRMPTTEAHPAPSRRRWLRLEPPAARWTLAAASVLFLAVLVQFRQADRLRVSLDRAQRDADVLRSQIGDAERRAADAERQITTVNEPTASANRGAAPPAAPAAPVVATFVLTPGLTRSAQGPARVEIPPAATTLRFQLNLDFDGGYRSLNAELRNDAGVPVWNERGLQARKAANRSAVTITIPAVLMPGGDYELVLQGVLKDTSVEDAATFHVTVVR
jgi:hypothetical protein